MCKASKAPLAHPQPPCRGARATLWQPLSLHCGPARHAPKPAAQGPKAQHKIGYIRFYRYIFVYRYTQTAGVEAPRASQQASCQAAGAHFGAGKRLQGPLQVCGRDVGGGLQLQVGQAVCVVEQHQDGHLVRADVELVLAPPKVRPQVCSTPRVSSVQALALLLPCHPCSALTAWGRGWSRGARLRLAGLALVAGGKSKLDQLLSTTSQATTQMPGLCRCQAPVRPCCGSAHGTPAFPMLVCQESLRPECVRR